MKIPLALPSLGEPEALAAREAILSGWVTQGPRVKRFEEDFAAYTGAVHACAVSNCTTALQLALMSVGVGPGDVVITVSYSFIATANAIRHCQAEPVFVDIAPGTVNMDPIALERCLNEDFESSYGSYVYRDRSRILTDKSPLHHFKGEAGRLAAILLVHQGGMPADLRSVLEIARRFNVPVIEDAACAAGSEISLDNGKTWDLIGKPHGEIACFSFHPRKVITTGDGGMMTARKPEHDRFARVRRHHGMSISDLERHSSTAVIFEDYPTEGFNFRMTDVQAAIGIEQLKRLKGLVKERREIARIYFEALEGIEGVTILLDGPSTRTNYQSFMIFLDRPEWQKPLMQHLLDLGIATRRAIQCAHLEVPYSEGWAAGSLPESERARDTGVVLPLFPGMSREQVAMIAREIRQGLAKIRK